MRQAGSGVNAAFPPRQGTQGQRALSRAVQAGRTDSGMVENSPYGQDLADSLNESARRVESALPEWECQDDRARLADVAGLLRRAAELASEGWVFLAVLLTVRAFRMPGAELADFGLPFIPLRWDDLDAEIDRAEAYRREEIRRAPYRRRAAAPFEFTPEPAPF